jgi:hypothetical protein
MVSRAPVFNRSVSGLLGPHQSPIRIKAWEEISIENSFRPWQAYLPQKTVGTTPSPTGTDAQIRWLPCGSNPLVADGVGVPADHNSRELYLKGRDSGQSGLVVLSQPPITTVSLRMIHDVAAGTAREFSDDGAGQKVAQGGDGIGHVALRALGCRAACNLGVGKGFLSERSFFWSRYV